MDDGGESVTEDEDEARWVRLGSLVRDTRIRAGYRTQRALAEAMGVSSKLINNIELGKNRSYSRASMIAIEEALGWFPGSVMSILGGGEPIEERPVPPKDWRRFAYHVRNRRQAVGLSQSEVADRGGLPGTVVEQIESAVPTRNVRTLSRLDVGLGWPQGSALRVLGGGEPPTAPGAEPKPLSPTTGAYKGTLSRAIHPSRQGRGLGDLSYEDLFDRWARLFAQSLAIEMEYMRRRGLSQPGEARDELWEVLVMADQGRDGRPWAPPWEAEEEISDDEAQDHINFLRDAGLIDEHGEPIEDEDEDDEQPHDIPEPELPDPAGLPDLAHPPMPDWSQVAARRGESEGRRAREQQDRDGEE